MKLALTLSCAGILGLNLLAASQGQLPDAPSSNLQQLGDIPFTLAPGLTVELVAGPPLIKWPVVADWDATGRLVVVESAGVAKPIEEHNKQLLHRIVRLVDEDGDGTFERRIVAADQLPFPEGVLCLGDSLLVSAPPHIWKLTDADGDGVCEAREIWFDGQTITGCANDLHGPYLGRDGWIYWCKGAFAAQRHELLDGSLLNDSAAHIYRRKFSGGAIEPVMSGGMDNPVEVAFTPAGERFFTSTFLQHPGDGLRDGIAHAVYGGVYGKDHSVLEGLTRTGPLMPIMTQLGPAAPSGLTYLESNCLLPEDEAGAMPRTLAAALFNLNKVTAHRLEPQEATFTTQDSDLLVAHRVDFHPTDILEDADGSLLVVDTGGWYDLCCPTSRVDQQTASGGIYRLRRQKSIPRPELQSVDWQAATPEACVVYLNDPRPWVARMAGLKLAELDAAAIEPLTNTLLNQKLSVDQRLRSLWGLSAVGTEQALAAVALALTAEQPELVQAACHAVSVHRYRPAKEALEQLVANPVESAQQSLAVLRAGAEGLGRIGDGQSIDSLMKSLPRSAKQPVVAHSLLFAMLEIGQPDAIAPFLESAAADQRTAAMFLLDKLGDTRYLSQKKVLASTAAASAAERAMAIEILSRHPEWSEAAAPIFAEFPREELLPVFTAWSDQPQVHQLLANWIERRQGEAWEISLGRLLNARRGQAPPAACVAPLSRWMQQDPHTVVELLLNMDLTPEHCRPLLSELQKQITASRDLEAQLKLVSCLPPNHSFAAPELTNQLVDLFVASGGTDRTSAGHALLRLTLDETAARRLVAAVPTLAPRELSTAAELVSSAGVDALDTRLLEQLADVPAARTLPIGFLERLYRERSADLRRLASSTEKQLAAPNEDVAAQVALWLRQLPAGDSLRGLEVFRGNKAACTGCHQLGYVGGRIGPELSRIGHTRTREALLEAILFPNSRIEQSYQPLKVLTLDGQVYNGLVKSQSDHRLELQLTVDRSVTLEASDIEQQEVSHISIMPSGMQEVLTPQEIADLLSLLEASR